MPADIDQLVARGLISPIALAKLKIALAQQQQQQPPQLSQADAAAMQPETFVPAAAIDWAAQAAPKDFGIMKGMGRNLAALPQRAMQAAANYQPGDPGSYDPSPIVEAATLPMGMGAIAGVPMRAGEMALGAGAVRSVKSTAMEAPKELYHVVGPDYAAGEPLRSLYSRLGDDAYEEFAKRWPDAGDLALDHPHKTFFFTDAKAAAQHADDFGGQVLRVDPSKVEGLLWDKLENPGYWVTRSDVPPDALSPWQR